MTPKTFWQQSKKQNMSKSSKSLYHTGSTESEPTKVFKNGVYGETVYSAIQANSKDGVKNRDQILHFLTPIKFNRGRGEMSE